MAVAAAAIFATSCQQGADTTSLSGEVTEEVDQITVSVINPENTKTFDTLAVTDSKFDQDIALDSMEFLLLNVAKNYAVPLFVKPGEQVKLNLNGNADNQLFEVSGSYESERIQRITEIRTSAFARIDSLNQLSREAKGTDGYDMKKAQFDAAFQDVVEETEQKFKSMVEEDPGSIANIFIFSQSIGRYQLINPQEDFKYFTMVDSALAESYPTLRHTKNFRQGIAQMKEQMAMQEQMNKIKENLQPGNEVPDIAMPGPNGETKKLSDLRGKVVLVDFWAAWCRPCRAQNPHVVKMYNEYKDQGFTVYSVSLDGLPRQQNPKDAWTQAIKQDGLTWDNHVSELKGWDSEVVMDFGFNGIPFTVLVDREGKIVATELRGPELEAKVKETLGS